MCRWVLYKGRPICLADIVINPGHSLIKMANEHYMPNIVSRWDLTKMVSAKHRNHEVNADGFGVGWYDTSIEPTPSIFASPNAAAMDRNLQRISTKIFSPLIFAHVRAATPGLQVLEQNCHPFQFGRFMFMHNGGIAQFGKIKARMISLMHPRVYPLIQGTTDSEHAAALFCSLLPGADVMGDYSPEQMGEALQATVRIIVRLSNDLEAEAAEDPVNFRHVASSLNFAVSDGRNVVACRFRDSVTEQPPSLYICEAAEVVKTSTNLSFTPKTEGTERNAAVLIASEPLTFEKDSWKLIPRNSIVTIYEDNRVKIADMTVEASPHVRRLFRRWKGRTPTRSATKDIESVDSTLAKTATATGGESGAAPDAIWVGSGRRTPDHIVTRTVSVSN